MDIWKFDELSFLNEEVWEFTIRWSQNLVNVRRPSYLNFSFGHGDVLLV